MRFVAPPISNDRLQRAHRWAMLWLTWFTAFLEAAAEFAPITKQVEEIAHLWLHPRKGAPRRRLNYGPTRRAIIGSRLRRALRCNDLHQRIEVLRQNIASQAALLKRLPRGLTRHRPIAPGPESHCIPACGVFHTLALRADTS